MMTLPDDEVPMLVNSLFQLYKVMMPECSR